MSNISVTKTLLFSLAFAFVSQLAYNFYNKKKKEGKKQIHEVIMFSHGVAQLKKSRYSKLMITKSFDRLLYHLNSTRYTLDLCLYVFTNNDLLMALQKLCYRGVKIRLIIDADMAFSSGSCVHKVEKLGIPVRWRKSTNLMHHKFCLLDTSTDNPMVTSVVIIGSLNWTAQALHGNWENVAVTSQDVLVQQYRAEFERLWTLFKPIVN